MDITTHTFEEEFREVPEEIFAAPLRSELKWLHDLAKQYNGQPILEIGTGSGASTLALATACPGSHIDTYDMSEKIYGTFGETGYICKPHNKYNVTYHHRTSCREVYRENYGFCFIDGDHIHPAPLLDTIMALRYSCYQPALVFHDLENKKFYNIPHHEGPDRVWKAIVPLAKPGTVLRYEMMGALQVENSNPFETIRHLLLNYSYADLPYGLSSHKDWLANRQKIWDDAGKDLNK